MGYVLSNDNDGLAFSFFWHGKLFNSCIALFYMNILQKLPMQSRWHLLHLSTFPRRAIRWSEMICSVIDAVSNKHYSYWSFLHLVGRPTAWHSTRWDTICQCGKFLLFFIKVVETHAFFEERKKFVVWAQCWIYFLCLKVCSECYFWLCSCQ